jgi:carboxyl-terminal processing protease
MSSLLILFALIATAMPVVSTARAQVLIPAEALADENLLQQVLQQGQHLEQQRRWGEALSHYEQSLREHPERSELQQRLTVARIHFDLGRRYGDSSFLASLIRMSEREALDVYAEVLLKIQAHYVDEPNWQQLMQRGVMNLDVALTEPVFLERNLPNVAPERIAAFGRDLHRTIDSRAVRSRQEASDVAASAASLAAQQLGMSPQAVIMEYTCGATGALDDYSTFLTGTQLEDVFSQIEGNFVGLGIELKADNRSLLIVSVITGGPAERGGMKAGDRIVEVDGKSTNDISTDAAADLLKGIEGSMVDLVVLGADGNSRRLRLRRERVEVPSVENVKLLDREQGIGYFRLSSFQKTTNRDVDAALWKLHHEGMRSLIVDVRGNPGGLLTASVEVADKFVSAGTIVSTRGRSPREDFDYKAHQVGTWRVPLIVLIDGDSASASEIFAGAIHDHRRGTVVGQRSYGKGSVQGIFPLNVSTAGVRLTTAKFYSPSGQPISHRGVSPDIVVRTAAKPIGEANQPPTEQDDPVLKAGLQVARQQLSQR